jgi:hypothetical protein
MHFHWHHHHHGGGHAGGPMLPSLPPASGANADLAFLDPQALHFRREGTRLQMRQADEEEWQQVTLVRLFPLTDPDTWLSLLDQEGREVGVLLELSGLPPEAHALVSHELRRRYLVPEVQRVVSVGPRYDLMEWVVETDRGRTSFLTRNLREQQQPPGSNRVIIMDIEGNRYDVPDLDGLDPASRRRLEAQL